MKKFIEWLKSPKSDYVLLIIVLILLNLVGIKLFFRLDLTSPHSYSLSKVSKQVVRNLEEPLAVKVFFSDGLPAPYNTTKQYLKDILVEYKGAANKNFSYEFLDMEREENQELAGQYRIRQQQIQEVRDNEVGFKNVYMGLAVLYADSIETIDGITDSTAFEYKLTSKITSMINKTSVLAGLKGSVNLTLYATEKLADFEIHGFDQMGQIFTDSVANVNKGNMNKIVFNTVDPTSAEIDEICSKYGIEPIEWTNPDGKTSLDKNGRGMIAAVIEYEDSFRVLPVRLSRGIFGMYGIVGLDTLEESINDGISSLVCRTESIGYLSGFGCHELVGENGNPSPFAQLIDDRYEFVELDLTKDEIPNSINQIVINGPKQKISEDVFYKLDQFLMRGGNLTVFADSFEEVPSDNPYTMPTCRKIDSGLNEFLAKYGIVLSENIVMDKNCYKQNQPGYGEYKFYYAPILDYKGMNQKNPISRNLAYVLIAQSSSVDFDKEKASGTDIKATVLARSSSKSWEEKDNVIFNPMYIVAKEDANQQFNIALLVEGKFDSQFESNPAVLPEDEGGTALSGGDSKHLSKAVQKGKIFVCGTSQITTPMCIDSDASTPIAIFERNAIDYQNGNADLCSMRSKGLSLNTLNNFRIASVRIAKIFNEFVVPLLVIAVGFIVWRLRIKHRKEILKKYSTKKTDIRETLAVNEKEKDNDK